jgi:chemotaxis-related protein WspB
MLFLLFQIGRGRYAVDAGRVVEVLPLMRVDHLPHAPAGMAGVLCYRGAPLPVIDLSLVLLNCPAQQKLSTRILVVDCAGGRRLGLIAERANGTLRREPGDFQQTGVLLEGVPFLGPVTRDERGFVLWIDPDQLAGGALLQHVVEAA